MATILIVDEDAAARDALRTILERSGHLVAAVPRGRDALELIETIAFDVVLSELYMDDFDGLELLMAVRKLHPELPIILMADPTRKSYQPVAAVAQHLGAAGRLVKPIDPESVRRVLDRVLAA